MTEASEAAEAAADAEELAGNPDVPESLNAPVESNPEDETLDENGYMKR